MRETLGWGGQKNLTNSCQICTDGCDQNVSDDRTYLSQPGGSIITAGRAPMVDPTERSRMEGKNRLILPSTFGYSLEPGRPL